MLTNPKHLDKVRCTNCSGQAALLTVGHVYHVNEVFPDTGITGKVSLLECGGMKFEWSRFESEKPSSIEPELHNGDWEREKLSSLKSMFARHMMENIEKGVRSESEDVNRVLEYIDNLKSELKTTEALLETRNALLAVIPGCEAHGDQCVPHAIEWVQSITGFTPTDGINALPQPIRQYIHDLKADVANALSLSPCGHHYSLVYTPEGSDKLTCRLCYAEELIDDLTSAITNGCGRESLIYGLDAIMDGKELKHQTIQEWARRCRSFISRAMRHFYFGPLEQDAGNKSENASQNTEAKSCSDPKSVASQRFVFDSLGYKMKDRNKQENGSTRLFVMSPNSDGQWWYCGGPSIDDAATGLANVIRCDVEALMLEQLEGEPQIILQTRKMTDREVEELADY